MSLDVRGEGREGCLGNEVLLVMALESTGQSPFFILYGHKIMNHFVVKSEIFVRLMRAATVPGRCYFMEKSTRLGLPFSFARSSAVSGLAVTTKRRSAPICPAKSASRTVCAR